MNYRIEKKEPFRIVGYKRTVPNSPDNTEAFSQIPEFWRETAAQGKIPALCKLMDAQPVGVLGVSVGDWQNDATFDYYIAVASTQPQSEKLFEYQVPGCTWAIFECKGAMPFAIQNMQKRIMTEWFPNSEYQYADAPDIEVYSDGDMSSEEYTCWIWVPVKK